MTLPQLSNLTIPRDPCWTSIDENAICSRGGIGCPLHHDDGSYTPRQSLSGRWDPREFYDYPNYAGASWVCPTHRRSTTYGSRVTFCPACTSREQRRQRRPWGDSPTVRLRRAAKKKRRFMRMLREIDAKS